eukprot:CAMPEP_0119122788 /NCGR_PEP_ID=MMETSP1310-20130426/2943_1 /TAXON_ID=464262 /ORGANISM="Genus nov. species nov., Strain RCC2339" /LENGTH=414 /DNA_ID=CAMNT_0007112501 /DNA_START=30 /DNA_END=1274 /DNA_ORIENTATION=-
MNEVLVCLLLIVGVSSGTVPDETGEFKYRHAAFVQIFPSTHGGTNSLWLTSFQALGKGKVSYVIDIEREVVNNTTSSITAKDVSGGFLWPNLVSYIPKGVIGGDDSPIALVPDGFLVPGKSTGGLFVVYTEEDGSLAKGNSLVAPKDGWFYHMAEWIDLNGDGRLDVLTARAKVNTADGTFGGELLWLEQPATDALSGNWTETVMVEGPDVLFAVADLDPTDGAFEVYCAQFFSNLLTLVQVDERTAAVRRYEVIEELPAPYDIHVVDLQGDGTLELLVTEHEGGAGGNVTAYEIPGDFLNPAAYVKHTLATGFAVTKPGANEAAPGFVTPVFRSKADREAGAYTLLVAGDGSQAGYWMEPTGVTPWSYTTEVLKVVDGVVGIIAAAYERNAEETCYFFLPCYDSGMVYSYVFG